MCITRVHKKNAQMLCLCYADWSGCRQGIPAERAYVYWLCINVAYDVESIEFYQRLKYSCTPLRTSSVTRRLYLPRAYPFVESGNVQIPAGMSQSGTCLDRRG